MRQVRIATRGSKLALWQAEHVRDLLRAGEADLSVALVVIKTSGDRVLDRPLYEIGGKGLFTKEIEEALLSGQADVAVHSMKDVPSVCPEGLLVAAVPRREDPRDALLCAPALREAAAEAARAGHPLAALPRGATVGTTSLRRVSQLLRRRPDLSIVPLRGNVDTRLRKLEAAEMDAVVLAVAGLARLGYGDRIDAALDPAEFVPAVGQGALALQCRVDDADTRRLLERLHDGPAGVAVRAERAFLAALEGSCRTPLGAHGTLLQDTLRLDGFLANPWGKKIVRGHLLGPREDAARLGTSLGERLLGEGGREILDALSLPGAGP